MIKRETNPFQILQLSLPDQAASVEWTRFISVMLFDVSLLHYCCYFFRGTFDQYTTLLCHWWWRHGRVNQNGKESDPYRREKAREMAESVLLADGSNQNSPSVQLVSAREDHSSTAARAPNTFLHTGGEKSEESRYASRSRGSKREGCRNRTMDTRKEEKFRMFKASVFFFTLLY